MLEKHVFSRSGTFRTHQYMLFELFAIAEYTSFFSFTAVNWTVFFFTCLKKQEEMLVSVSESLQSEAGSARDETNNQNISYNSPRDGNPIVKVKV